MIGQTLGNYRIVEQIGEGGMAAVYKAYDPGTDRHVAIKILPEHYSQAPIFRERFRREAKAIAKLEHPHILPIHAYGEEEDTIYLVMRYMAAGTLKDRIQSGALSLSDVGSLLSQLADALDYAHEHNILHRDVKPGNVLLDERGNAYLTDFGIAKMVEGAVDVTGDSLLGTPQYMSPEQCQGSKDLTPATDQYALGIILYEMLAGRTPFQAETPMAMILQHLQEAPPPIQDLRADLPSDTAQVITKALLKDPAGRYSSCGEMAEAFAQAVSGVTVSAAPTLRILGEGDDATTLPVAPLPSRRKIPVWAWGIIGLFVVAGLVVAVLSSGLNASSVELTLTPEPSPTHTIVPSLTPTPIPPLRHGEVVVTDAEDITGLWRNTSGTFMYYEGIIYCDFDEDGTLIADGRTERSPEGEVIGISPVGLPLFAGTFLFEGETMQLRLPDGTMGGYWKDIVGIFEVRVLKEGDRLISLIFIPIDDPFTFSNLEGPIWTSDVWIWIAP